MTFDLILFDLTLSAIAVRDRMFLEKQDFDVAKILITFAQIRPNFAQI